MDFWINLLAPVVAGFGGLLLGLALRGRKVTIDIYKTGEPDSLTNTRILELVDLWIDRVSTTETRKICKCPWQIHPDDTEKLAGTRRMRRVDDDPRCPVHTKAGYLIGFLEWVGQTRVGD